MDKNKNFKRTIVTAALPYASGPVHIGHLAGVYVPPNEFLNLEGSKISTSRNYAVRLNEYLEELPDRQDELRYVLTANAPKTKDNDFTWADFQARCNNELVTVYGNFVNRALQLTQKYFDGIVPECGELTEHDNATLAEIAETKRKAEQLIEQLKFREAQKEVLNLARAGNRYIADEEPWKIIKTDETRVKTILYVSLQITASLAILFEPFLPFSSARLRRLLRLENAEWQLIGNGELLSAGSKLQRPELLFRKVEDDEIKFQTDKLTATIASNRQKGNWLVLHNSRFAQK